MDNLSVFLDRMKTYLNEEDFEAFKNSFHNDVQKCIRINPLKANVEDFKSNSPYQLRESNISKYHFYVDEAISGNHPYHLAGVYYMQECSAGSAVEALHVEKGDKVLDLCSAPGGKSTQIAGYLENTGLLVANEYVANRSQILLSNIERMGPCNVIIINEHPTKLCKHFEGFFDKVLVDAPCSGEGMFHKDERALAEWSPEHVSSCAMRQFEIINDAYVALKKGGEMVYSTCTFSLDENEELISKFLSLHDDMEIINAEVNFGRSAIKLDAFDTDKAIRIYPMDGGDGHFVCRMRKLGDNNETHLKKDNFKSNLTKEMLKFIDTSLNNYDIRNFFTVGDKLYYFEGDRVNVDKLKLVRYGVLCGEQVKSIFKPHHHFFMAFSNNLKNRISLSLDDNRLHQYLCGNEIHYESSLNGYVAVCVNDYVIGFGKISNNQIKNHYPKGLRLLQ
ncbi:MAG: RsmF rRNA methyltransferase first C-terminal domain-containing protein [Erysipelotrichales bacterium]|nr:RsmF rRNA methyltransferase first C-terminal domain-containing protein [Erysipelotrichales bacterium]